MSTPGDPSTVYVGMEAMLILLDSVVVRLIIFVFENQVHYFLVISLIGVTHHCSSIHTSVETSSTTKLVMQSLFQTMP